MYDERKHDKKGGEGVSRRQFLRAGVAAGVGATGVLGMTPGDCSA